VTAAGDAKPMRKVVHIDLDAFYASVEQRDDPRLRGRPVVVAWRGPRSVVCAASYEARRYGVRSAMPAMRAERLCPDAVFVAPDFTRYRAASDAVRRILLQHTDRIEPLSLDEAYLDLSTIRSGLPSATQVASAIRAQVREELQLTASAGVAPNKFLAKIASDWRKPDGQFVIRPHQVEAFLAPLPVARLPGVGKVTEARLAGLGVHTVSELRALTPARLEQQFGRYGQRLFELAQGIDETPVRPDRPVRSVSAEDTFEQDLPLAATEAAIRRLAEKSWVAVQAKGLAPRTVVLKLKTSDFRILTRSHTGEPLADANTVIRTALALRERVADADALRFRLAGVGLANFAGQRAEPPLQEELFEVAGSSLPHS
jgi:DNA polymerase-4